MNYWRMQLHPNSPEKAVAHTIRSLGLGYIGLDFAEPPGDLTDVKAEDIPQSQRDYWDFAHVMEVGDLVLVVAHHYPCALAEVVGPYNYIRDPESELGGMVSALSSDRSRAVLLRFGHEPEELATDNHDGHDLNTAGQIRNFVPAY